MAKKKPEKEPKKVKTTTRTPQFDEETVELLRDVAAWWKSRKEIERGLISSEDDARQDEQDLQDGQEGP